MKPKPHEAYFEFLLRWIQMSTTYVLLNKSITWYIPFWRLYFCHNKNFRMLVTLKGHHCPCKWRNLWHNAASKQAFDFFFKKCVLWFRLNLQWRDATSLHWLRDTGCCTWEKSSKILFQVWKDSPSLLYFEKPLSKSRSIDAEDQEAELCKIAHYRCTLTPTFFAPSAWHQTVKDDLSPSGFGRLACRKNSRPK